MSENSKDELDIIKNNDNQENYKTISHNSSLNSNKFDYEDDEFIKSVNNIAKVSNMASLSRNIYSSESEDLFQYQKNKTSASSSEIRNQKFSNFQKKLSELSQNLNPILVVNSLSPTKKKKMASFKMVEKTKYKKMFDTQEFNARRVDQETITGRERRDAYGNIIKKKNRKKIKVSFIDQINEEQPLVNVVDIESYKKYNFIIGMPKEDHIKKNQATSNCQCCIMF